MGMRTSIVVSLLLAVATFPSVCWANPALSNPVPDAGQSRTLIASLERGACLGRCPQYAVRVYSDGLVEFEGRRFVATAEKASATLTAAELKAVRSALEAAHFESFKPAYTRPTTTDLPTVIVSNGRKTVRHALGDQTAPASLTRLEQQLDELLHTTRWMTQGVEQ